MPRVSVLTPLYKTRPEHLREMIDSILGQTFQDFKFLLLNDSPDDKYIRNIVESYKEGSTNSVFALTQHKLRIKNRGIRANFHVRPV